MPGGAWRIIGSAQIILDLEQIASVTTVLGNTDSLPDFREFERVVLGEFKFILHRFFIRLRRLKPCKSASTASGHTRSSFGHTHKQYCERIGEMLSFNPGYAGKDRFGLKRTVGILVADRGKITPEIIPL